MLVRMNVVLYWTPEVIWTRVWHASVMTVPRKGEVILIDEERYEVEEVEHLLTEPSETINLYVFHKRK